MKKVRILLLVVAGLLLAGWWLTRDDGRSTTVSGTVEQDEARLGARVSGRIAEILVREGDSVTNGQVLARLEGGEWAARRDYAAAVLAELEAGPRTEDVEAARAAWEARGAERGCVRDAGPGPWLVARGGLVFGGRHVGGALRVRVRQHCLEATALRCSRSSLGAGL